MSETTADIPYFSQMEAITTEIYGNSACGFTSLRMVLGLYGKNTDVRSLASLATSANAYAGETGWTHDGLLKMARSFQLYGYRFNYSRLDQASRTKEMGRFQQDGTTPLEMAAFDSSLDFTIAHGPLEDIRRILKLKVPVIASMEKTYANTTTTHLIVLKTTQEDGFTIHDPSKLGPNHRLSDEEFLNHWTKRSIVIFEPSSLLAQQG